MIKNEVIFERIYFMIKYMLRGIDHGDDGFSGLKKGVNYSSVSVDNCHIKALIDKCEAKTISGKRRFLYEYELKSKGNEYSMTVIIDAREIQDAMQGKES